MWNWISECSHIVDENRARSLKGQCDEFVSKSRDVVVYSFVIDCLHNRPVGTVVTREYPWPEVIPQTRVPNVLHINVWSVNKIGRTYVPAAVVSSLIPIAHFRLESFYFALAVCIRGSHCYRWNSVWLLQVPVFQSNSSEKMSVIWG